MQWSAADLELTATWPSTDATNAKQQFLRCSPDHLTPHRPLRASAAAPGLCCPYAMILATLPVTASFFHGSLPYVPQANPLSVHPPMMIDNICHVYNKRASVFRVQNIHTCTYAQPVGEATQDLPAPIRHNDIRTQTTHTPLQPQILARCLTLHPNQAFVSRLIDSLTNGFDLGYIGPCTQLTAPNLPYAYQYPTIVDEALQKEIAEHRID